MNVQTEPGLKTQEQTDKAMLVEYMQVINTLKAQHAEDMSQINQLMRERNTQVNRLKQENEKLRTHITRHNEDFKKYRGILSDLKEMAKDGSLTADVINGPELQSLNKEREKFHFLYKQEAQKSGKLESRCEAMSAQIIDRQKKIYRLEGLYMESEKQCQYLQALMVQPESNEWVEEGSKMDIKQAAGQVANFLQDRVPSWAKT